MQSQTQKSNDNEACPAPAAAPPPHPSTKSSCPAIHDSISSQVLGTRVMHSMPVAVMITLSSMRTYRNHQPIKLVHQSASLSHSSEVPESINFLLHQKPRLFLIGHCRLQQKPNEIAAGLNRKNDILSQRPRQSQRPQPRQA